MRIWKSHDAVASSIDYEYQQFFESDVSDLVFVRVDGDGCTQVDGLLACQDGRHGSGFADAHGVNG